MILSYFLLLMVGVSILFAAYSGTTPELGSAVLEGAGKAVELGISLAGVLCLWSGITEVMRRSGLMETISKVLRLPLGWLFPDAKGDKESMEDISCNVSANLLGLGNAATPLSIRAATRLHKLSGLSGVASDSLCMLVVLNAGSIQLIPATIAGVRAQAGAAAPFDILPAVWITTAASCAVGIIAARLMARLWKNKDRKKTL